MGDKFAGEVLARSAKTKDEKTKVMHQLVVNVRTKDNQYKEIRCLVNLQDLATVNLLQRLDKLALRNAAITFCHLRTEYHLRSAAGYSVLERNGDMCDCVAEMMVRLFMGKFHDVIEFEYENFSGQNKWSVPQTPTGPVNEHVHVKPITLEDILRETSIPDHDSLYSYSKTGERLDRESRQLRAVQQRYTFGGPNDNVNPYPEKETPLSDIEEKLRVFSFIIPIGGGLYREIRVLNHRTMADVLTIEQYRKYVNQQIDERMRVRPDLGLLWTAIRVNLRDDIVLVFYNMFRMDPNNAEIFEWLNFDSNHDWAYGKDLSHFAKYFTSVIQVPQEELDKNYEFKYVQCKADGFTVFQSEIQSENGENNSSDKCPNLTVRDQARKDRLPSDIRLIIQGREVIPVPDDGREYTVVPKNRETVVETPEPATLPCQCAGHTHAHQNATHSHWNSLPSQTSDHLNDFNSKKPASTKKKASKEKKTEISKNKKSSSNSATSASITSKQPESDTSEPITPPIEEPAQLDYEKHSVDVPDVFLEFVKGAQTATSGTTLACARTNELTTEMNATSLMFEQRLDSLKKQNEEAMETFNMLLSKADEFSSQLEKDLQKRWDENPHDRSKNLTYTATSSHSVDPLNRPFTAARSFSPQWFGGPVYTTPLVSSAYTSYSVPPDTRAFYNAQPILDNTIPHCDLQPGDDNSHVGQTVHQKSNVNSSHNGWDLQTSTKQALQNSEPGNFGRVPFTPNHSHIEPVSAGWRKRNEDESREDSQEFSSNVMSSGGSKADFEESTDNLLSCDTSDEKSDDKMYETADDQRTPEDTEAEERRRVNKRNGRRNRRERLRQKTGTPKKEKKNGRKSSDSESSTADGTYKNCQEVGVKPGRIFFPVRRLSDKGSDDGKTYSPDPNDCVPRAYDEERLKIYNDLGDLLKEKTCEMELFPFHFKQYNKRINLFHSFYRTQYEICVLFSFLKNASKPTRNACEKYFLFKARSLISDAPEHARQLAELPRTSWAAEKCNDLLLNIDLVHINPVYLSNGLTFIDQKINLLHENHPYRSAYHTICDALIMRGVEQKILYDLLCKVFANMENDN